MSKKRLIPVILLLIILASLFFYYQNGNGNNTSRLFYGNVDYRTVKLGFRVPGRVETLPIEEGVAVKKGDILATLDAAPYDDLIAQTRAQIAAQKALVAKLTAGFRPEEIALAEATLKDAKALYEHARKNYDRERPLFESKVIAEQQFDATRFAFNSAKAKLANAKAALELKEKGYRKEEIDQAKASLEALEAGLKKQQLDRSDTRLASPHNGILLVRIKEPGSVVGYGEPVVELAQNDGYWVSAYLEEPDLGNITEGMEALVYTDSRPGTPYHGSISFISPTAEFTPKSVQTPDLRTDLVYRFKVTLRDTDAGIRQGMPVTVAVPALQ